MALKIQKPNSLLFSQVEMPVNATLSIIPPTPVTEEPQEVTISFSPSSPNTLSTHLLPSHSRSGSVSSYNSSSLSKRSSLISNLDATSQDHDNDIPPVIIENSEHWQVVREKNMEDQDNYRLNYEYYSEHKNEVDVGAEMEKWYSEADRYGFISGDELEESRSGPPSAAELKEAERAKKWANMAKQDPLKQIYSFPNSSKFIRRAYKGVPDAWRGQAWYFMITNELKSATDDSELLSSYQDLLKLPSTHERQIDLDIPRTMYGHIMFKTRYGFGQRTLFRVLHAFSNYDPEVGYCQGMSSVAAMLLMYFEEEKCFTALVHLFKRYNLHNLFIPGFPALLESFYIQDRLIERFVPKVFKKFAELQIAPSAYGTRWYITLFTGGVVPYRTLLRIWDVFFLEGFDALFFISVELLKSNQGVLATSDFEQAMNLLSSKMPVNNNDAFMRRVKRLIEKNKEEKIVEGLRHHYRKNLKGR